MGMIRDVLSRTQFSVRGWYGKDDTMTSTENRNDGIKNQPDTKGETDENLEKRRNRQPALDPEAMKKIPEIDELFGSVEM